ncbi:MAG: WYL domain-containing protein [Rhodospirillaceae bacterium]|nr:MAG: WYL domain-containing protein [Rhodospirillaceae bacterium]
MAQEIGKSRRTAERFRDAMEQVFPLEIAEGDDRIKRWRIQRGYLNRLISFSPDELADLRTAKALMEQEGRTDAVDRLSDLEAKIQALMSPQELLRMDPDLEALTEAEGYAMRPGPRPKLDEDLIYKLRDAVKSCRAVRIQYEGRESGKLSWQTVQPYGFLYGHRHYLIAWFPYMEDWRNFPLTNIHAVEVQNEGFTRDLEFSLKDYAERSFGVFQEEPFDVVWKFTPEAARDARDYVFHPTQTLEDQSDGSLIVRFHAGGHREMAWHLHTWGDAVEVLEPEDFWEWE